MVVKVPRAPLVFLLGTLFLSATCIYVMSQSLAWTFYLEKAASPSCIPSVQANCVSLLWLDWENRELIFPLYSALVDVSPGVLCLVLDSSVQEKHGHTGEKGHKELVLVELMLMVTD